MDGCEREQGDRAWDDAGPHWDFWPEDRTSIVVLSRLMNVRGRQTALAQCVGLTARRTEAPAVACTSGCVTANGLRCGRGLSP